MTSSSTTIGDRRASAAERRLAQRRHPSQRDGVKAATPPPLAYYLIAGVVLVLTMLGLVMVFAATSIAQLHKGNSPWRIFNRQFMWAICGGIGLWVALSTPMRKWRRFVRPALLGSYVLALLPFVPSIGNRVNSASSWVAISGFSFQPSEFVKLAVLLAAADLLAQRHREMHDPARTLIPVLAMAVVAMGLLVFQGDLGSAIVIAGIVFSMVFIAGAPLVPVAALGGLGGALMLAFAMSSPRRAARFSAFLDIAGHKDTIAYQTWQAMIGMANGGFTGSGVGGGSNMLGGFLPLAQSDFIFAVIAEELGLIGVIAVLGGFVVLAFGGVQAALATPDHFHRMVAGGIVGWLMVQTIINVGGVTGLMPVTGLTLPFFSAGGSSLFVTLVASGLLLNVARNVR